MADRNERSTLERHSARAAIGRIATDVSAQATALPMAKSSPTPSATFLFASASLHRVPGADVVAARVRHHQPGVDARKDTPRPQSPRYAAPQYRSAVKVLVIQGAGMNMRGKSEVEIFGPLTLEQLNAQIRGFADELGLEVEFFQSNVEGEVCDSLYASHDADVDAALI